ncbi:hypothetical protein HRU45_00570 [Candidatus Dependentiae bacterium]|nr:hypothetical protein [Candidatus Dependentiae bacterium]
MKTIKLLFACALFSINYVHAESQAELDQTVPITQFSNKVHRRFYFVERLHTTMEVLAQLNEKLDQCNFLVRSNQTCLKQVKKNCIPKALKPLFMMWEDFSIYKRLEDDLFVEEFTKEIFVVAKAKLFEELTARGALRRVLKSKLDEVSYLSIEQRVDLVAAIGGFLRGHRTLDELTDEIEEIFALSKNNNFDDITSQVDSERVLHRFYHVERLRSQLNILNILKRLDLNFFKDTQDQEATEHQLDDKITFKHQRVKRAVQGMTLTGNLDSLINLLEDFNEFTYMGDDEFARESMVALFLAEKNIIVNHAVKTKDANAIAQIIALYQTINSLPIEELLTAIDLLTKAFEEVLGQTEESSGSSWNSIFNDSWWSKPLAAVFFIFKLLKLFNS